MHPSLIRGAFSIKEKASCTGSRWGRTIRPEPSGQSRSGGSGFFGLARRLSTGEPFPGETLDGTITTLGIVDPEPDALRMPKIKFGQVAVKCFSPQCR
jgi:hypothetical protein